MKPKNHSLASTKNAILCLFFPFFACFLRAQDGVVSGEFIFEPPTLLNLGFEWKITGEENRNAKVEVSYRKTGTSEWLPGMPLRRIGGKRVFREVEQLDYTIPH